MAENTEKSDNMDARRKRIKRIKRIIVGTCITLLILPTILTVILMFRVSHLEKRISELSENKISVQQQKAELEASEKNTPEPQKQVEKEPVKKKVYLTFDDGPSSQTEKILDILKKNDVKATFFITGKEDSSAKEIVKRMAKEGHTIGMHSYSHNYLDIYESGQTFAKDFDKIYDYVKDITGSDPQWYRFPGGSSAEYVESQLADYLQVLKEKNVAYLDWNVISPDINNPSASQQQVMSAVEEGVAAFDTSVVLLYDSADKPMTVKALPGIIKKLKKENYELLPVASDMQIVQHNHLNKEDKE